ncbi:cache domain-containing protein [Undibacterium sp. RTI2.1]|uniref:cache domain-containing protein n=1 Tax=unclassified Undibacterium TaxID=2630295 RepID=UPI002B2397A5|nr:MULTISPECIES: cache domain-containing protein [unclassified Undibacterium]MEB0031876.1 cache domain-containing protein [Undibacterium sp. RTI2.1]MEB0118156.1 cache domain-containing protein [Undibacterium sp. RTI2.2]
MKAFIKILVATVFAGVFAISFTGSALAVEHGSAQEATDLVKKVIAYYKANGKEKTFAEINDPKGQFLVKDLYIFAGTVKGGGPTLAHGANPKLIGKSLGELKDVDGVFFVRKMTEVAASKEGKGWVDYKWPNPITKVLEQKSTYVERVDDLYFACGIYKG